MILTPSDYDTIAMYKFKPVRGSERYRQSLNVVLVYTKSYQCMQLTINSRKIARGICESFKTKP